MSKYILVVLKYTFRLNKWINVGNKSETITPHAYHHRNVNEQWIMAVDLSHENEIESHLIPSHLIINWVVREKRHREHVSRYLR